MVMIWRFLIPKVPGPISKKKAYNYESIVIRLYCAESRVPILVNFKEPSDIKTAAEFQPLPKLNEEIQF